MIRGVKGNFMSDRNFSSELWQCDKYGSCETTLHLTNCMAYQHLRVGKDLTNDKDLVYYFREVLELRDEACADDDVEGDDLQQE